MSAESPAPEATVEAKRPKSIEEIGKQVAKISGILIDRAASAGAGQVGNPIEWVREGNGGISVDTGRVDTRGNSIKQTIVKSEGRYPDSGQSFTLTEGANTLAGNTLITADESGAMTAAKSTDRIEESRNGIQQPDGSNQNGFSNAELISTTANQLFAVKQAVGQAEVNAGILRSPAPAMASAEAAAPTTSVV